MRIVRPSGPPSIVRDAPGGAKRKTAEIDFQESPPRPGFSLAFRALFACHGGKESAMSKRRRRFLALGLCVCVLLTGSVLWLLLPRTAITRENAALIQVGMTRAKVQAILGGPPRNDTSGPVSLDLDT